MYVYIIHISIHIHIHIHIYIYIYIYTHIVKVTEAQAICEELKYEEGRAAVPRSGRIVIILLIVLILLLYNDIDISSIVISSNIVMSIMIISTSIVHCNVVSSSAVTRSGCAREPPLARPRVRKFVEPPGTRCSCMYIYIYTYIHIHIYICVCTYIYIYILHLGIPYKPSTVESSLPLYWTDASFVSQTSLPFGRGDDTVGDPHRAQICKFELFELKLLNSSCSSLSSYYWN